MKQPSNQTLILGNPIVGLLTYGLTGFFIWMAFLHEDARVIAVIALFVAAYVTKCSKEASAYRLWKLEWDAMGGPARQPMADARPGLLKELFGAAVCLVIIWFAFDVLAPGHDTLKLITVSLCAAGIAVWLWQKLFKRKALAKQVGKDVQVSHCLPVPVQSPDAQRVYGALPAYCLRLFQRP